ncbi:MAG: hypothetical protein JWN34_363 [Bryobacterales bacterium]|nr:hypothetical protein [Bryobacterales bacterium]
MTSTPRGISCLNPGNIRISDVHWLGKVTPSRDKDFETFDSMEHGIRAIAKNILTYYDHHGYRTIAAIISHYAPPNENDSLSYIRNVEKRTGIDREQILDIRNPFVLCKLVQAICIQESGPDCVTTEQVANGVHMALA